VAKDVPISNVSSAAPPLCEQRQRESFDEQLRTRQQLACNSLNAYSTGKSRQAE
jgi:hypothetical protein